MQGVGTRRLGEMALLRPAESINYINEEQVQSEMTAG